MIGQRTIPSRQVHFTKLSLDTFLRAGVAGKIHQMYRNAIIVALK